ncbi:MAG: hypothetical protein AAF532_12665 [Planctomycetota bacterium]
MSHLRHASVALLAGLLTVAAIGCSTLWHDLQPHRLHRLNRGEAMPTGASVYE